MSYEYRAFFLAGAFVERGMGSEARALRLGAGVGGRLAE
jgi:hypothetical protein